MECLKNYQLRKNLGNNIFLYYSFLFDSLFPIKSQIIWKQMTLTFNPIPHGEGGRRGRYHPIVQQHWLAYLLSRKNVKTSFNTLDQGFYL